MKTDCKARLADWLKMTMDLEIDQDALIDIQRLEPTSFSRLTRCEFLAALESESDGFTSHAVLDL